MDTTRGAAGDKPRSANERIHRAWERQHPYNFVCLVDIDRSLPLDALSRAAQETLGEFGLWDGESDTKQLEIIVVSDLEEHAIRELNTTLVNPVRLAVRTNGPRARDARYALAITYRHLFFDGTNSTVFMRRTLIRAIGGELPFLHVGEFRSGRDFLRKHGLWKVPGLVVRLIRDGVKMHSVYARGDGRESPESQALFVDYSPGLLNRLRRDGDRVGATVNDVLVARMAGAALAMDSERYRKGRDIAISIAVSLRQGIEPLDPGVCVAVLPVFLRADDDLLGVVQKQTTRAKQTRSYMRSLIGMGVGSRLWRPPKTGCRNSSIYVPSLALTNMRIPASTGDELVIRWRRLVAVGPMAPLLVTALTHAERLEISLSWRKGLFSAQDIMTMVSHICE